MAETWKKLLLHKAGKALALNVPGGDYAALIGGCPEGVSVASAFDGETGTYDFVHLFVSSAAELEALSPMALEAVTPDGLLWFSYPKKSSKMKTDITRDTGWKPVRDAGYEGVTQISIDDTWSALRYRPASAIKVMTRKFTND